MENEDDEEERKFAKYLDTTGRHKILYCAQRFKLKLIEILMFIYDLALNIHHKETSVFVRK